ncbi:DNA-damage-repair/toleration protein, chloroplastic-like [Achlya hypogyna]|uniref:DNA-damage-repair/toleration protein, chloroplastic-like n=1 Tax=Achlya hypogyna TaxID=1202772 RepID=A0A1V9ZPG8_ACHHY|nr:DNA-damage-repair/toleration protein, chloroplastic-like [Achlya hypogyna]
MDDLYGDLPPTNDGSGVGLGFVPSAVIPKKNTNSGFKPMTFAPATPAKPEVKQTKTEPPTKNEPQTKNEPAKSEPARPANTKSEPPTATATPSLSWAAKKLAAKFANRPPAVATPTPTAAITPNRPSPASSTATLKTSLGLSSFTTVSVTRKTISAKQAEDAPAPTRDDDEDDCPRPAMFNTSDIRDEYDPTRPNDYMTFVEERKIRKKQQKVKRDLEKRQERLDREREKEKQELVRDVAAGRMPTVATTIIPGGRGRGVNLPAWMTKKIEETSKEHPPEPVGPSPRPQPGQYDDATEPPRGLGFVAAQTPSPVVPPPQPTQAPTRAPTPAPTPAPTAGPAKPRVSRFGQRVSRFDQKSPATLPKTVLLLQNMVAPGEVDDDLQGEVKEECQSKYGTVVKCLVYEVTTGVPAHEAVRIFVEFLHEADAAKALAGLHGRFFAGRKLHVTHFDKAKFDRLELAP